jgi:hypothetical protein
MNIQGLPPLDGGTRNVGDKKHIRSASVEIKNTSDSVVLSGASDSIEKTDQLYTAPVDFPVRSELINEVAERISQNEYNKPEILESVAVSMIDSLGGAESSDNASESVRNNSEHIQSLRVQAGDGYYNSSEILTATAAQLIESQGLTSLYGK